jgi:hypothetical protein
MAKMTKSEIQWAREDEEVRAKAREDIAKKEALGQKKLDRKTAAAIRAQMRLEAIFEKFGPSGVIAYIAGKWAIAGLGIVIMANGGGSNVGPGYLPSTIAFLFLPLTGIGILRGRQISKTMEAVRPGSRSS